MQRKRVGWTDFRRTFFSSITVQIPPGLYVYECHIDWQYPYRQCHVYLS